MGNMLVAEVRIKGVRPLLWHAFGPDALPLEKQERTGVAGHDPEEWRKTALVTKDGQLYVLPTYIFGCLRSGAANTKKGRGSIQKLVASTLQATDSRILIDRWFPSFPNGHEFDIKTAEPPPTDIDQPVFLDIAGVRNPSTGARNVRYRVGASVGWQTTFSLKWDRTIVSRQQMEAVTIDAGNLCGLGDGRSVGYGRFEVVGFHTSD